MIGEPILIQLLDNKDASIIYEKIKLLWPIDNNVPDAVQVMEYIMPQWNKDKYFLNIKKPDVCLKEIDKITLNVHDPEIKNINDDLEHGLILTIKKQYDGHVFRKNDFIQLKFMNKLFNLSVESFSDAKNMSLEDKLESLNLTKGDRLFYKITSRTEIILRNKHNISEFQLNTNKIFIGGLEKQEKEINEVILSKQKNVDLTKGILLYGSSGCGKTLLTKSLHTKFPYSCLQINALDIFSRYYGETETNLSNAFKKAQEMYPKFTIILIEDIHNLCPKIDSSDILKRVTSSFVNLFDRAGKHILLVATTNNIDALNPLIRRSGRLDYEIEIPVPNSMSRKEILNVLMKKHNISLKPENINELTQITHGYTGADLESLIIKSISSRSGCILYDDILRNLMVVKPSAMREIQIESPNIKWSDIGGQDDLKLKLQQAVEWPIKHPETFKRLGITPPKGLLMFGPPGCSKTMIAKALATESKLNFLSLKGSELFSMWVGESEKAVKKLFQKARELSPAIIFFDEIDAICGERATASAGSSVKERVLAQILTEIDGVNALKEVTIVAATNRPDLVDGALLRPGRLDRIIYVKLPDNNTRKEIFNIKLKNMPIDESVVINELIEKTEGYSGAEIQAVCQEAALHALEISFDAKYISKSDFEYALVFVQPRTSKDLLDLYDNYLNKFQTR